MLAFFLLLVYLTNNLVIMAGKKCTAKRKYEDEHWTFVTEWMSLFFLLDVIASHSALYARRHSKF